MLVCVCEWNEWNACVRVRVWSECEMRVCVCVCVTGCARGRTLGHRPSPTSSLASYTREKGTLWLVWLRAARSTQRVLSFKNARARTAVNQVRTSRYCMVPY